MTTNYNDWGCDHIGTAGLRYFKSKQGNIMTENEQRIETPRSLGTPNAVLGAPQVDNQAKQSHIDLAYGNIVNTAEIMKGTISVLENRLSIIKTPTPPTAQDDPSMPRDGSSVMYNNLCDVVESLQCTHRRMLALLEELEI